MSPSRSASTKTTRFTSYVAEIGKRMAAQSERPNLPWEFHVVDDAVGERVRHSGRLHLRDPRPHGFHQQRGRAGRRARVTRSGMSLIGTRCSRSASLSWPSWGSASEALFRRMSPSSDSSPAQALSLLFLKYGRDAENQADQSGMRYALAQSYDVRESAAMCS